MDAKFKQDCQKAIYALKTYKEIKKQAEDAHDKYVEVLSDIEDYTYETYGEDSAEFNLIWGVAEYIGKLECPRENFYQDLQSCDVDGVINKLQKCLTENYAKVYKRKYIKEELDNYENETKNGYPIVAKFRDMRDQRLYIVFKRADDYAYACGYDIDSGTWTQGGYDFKTKEDAIHGLCKYKHPILMCEIDNLSDIAYADKNRYAEETKDGYRIISRYVDDKGLQYIIFAMPRENIMDYCIGYDYDVIDGCWDQGYYSYATPEDAEKELFRKHKGLYKIF